MWKRRAGAVTASLIVLGACGGGDDADLEAFCARAADTAAFETAFADLDPMAVDETIETFRRAAEAQKELRADAPERVRADLDVLIAYVDDLVSELENLDPQTGDPRAVYEELEPRADAVEAASDRLALFVRVQCG